MGGGPECSYRECNQPQAVSTTPTRSSVPCVRGGPSRPAVTAPTRNGNACDAPSRPAVAMSTISTCSCVAPSGAPRPRGPSPTRTADVVVIARTQTTSARTPLPCVRGSPSKPTAIELSLFESRAVPAQKKREAVVNFTRETHSQPQTRSEEKNGAGAPCQTRARRKKGQGTGPNAPWRRRGGKSTVSNAL